MSMHNPPHPGEFIREIYIEPFAISVRSLAESLGVSPSTLARVVSTRSAVSPENYSFIVSQGVPLSRDMRA